MLDLACGNKEFERLSLQENPAQSFIGVDISERKSAIARQKCQAYPHVSFHVCSILCFILAFQSRPSCPNLHDQECDSGRPPYLRSL
ncbi:hypothetical protein ACQ4M4_15080 [Leptolyngbya sp. AN02str]|uniref:Uncharacterized protein n=1 Tax=Leptolyngbya sp. NK1-12 TaxID=2547451 RepID=A0AA97APP9_9CYAN|nr:hypothetical protein HJG54_34920 [Leptolyngbya sp. NK1-12]